MDNVILYTDGACSGNPGPGGFCAILKSGEHEKQISGSEKLTTNNRMELMAVIKGLDALKEPCDVTVISDSKYVTDAINKGWVYSWEANGWRKSDKKPAQNVDLWECLLALMDEHQVSFTWVEGHAGHPENERCDKLATDKAAEFSK